MTIDGNITKDQLNLIYNNSNDMIFMIGVEGPGSYRCLSVNRAYLDTTGIAAADLLNKPIASVFGSNEFEYLRTQYDEAVSRGAPHRYETKTILRGESVYLETTLVPIFGGNRCTHLIGVSRDSTERKLERKALQAEKARAENYLNIAEAIILGLDHEGKITLLNRKGYRVLGYPEGSLTGEDWISLCMNPDKRDLLRSTLLRAVRAGTLPDRSMTYVFTRTGERRLVRWSTTPVFDQENHFSGVLASGEDITERREAEKSMIASQRVLAAGEVAAAVAHDFNNALQGILGSLELALLDESIGTSSRSKLLAASSLAMDAAGRIQTLQRLNNSTQTGGSESFSINSLVIDVIAQTQHLWRDKVQKQGFRVGINTRLDDSLRMSPGQPGEIRSVLFNLLKNSIEALPEGGEIDITTWFTNGTNHVSITDNGLGMDEVTRSRIFQPFFTTKGFEAGRGLGLSASHAIVKSHGGDLRVERTAPGAGTSLEMRLPVAESTDSLAGVTPPTEIATKLHLLWVDDDPAVQIMARGYIDALGHTGDTAQSGEEALKLIASADYDVVITDLGMPGMNGFEVARRAAELTAGKTPVLALTGWGDTITPAEQARFEIYQVLSKPISLRELGEVLTRLPPNRS